MQRIVVKDDPAVYHVMSRVALDGYPSGDVEKENLLETNRHLSSVYFAETLGFCLMLDSCSAGDHMLLVKKY
jgi:putative transposase